MKRSFLILLFIIAAMMFGIASSAKAEVPDGLWTMPEPVGLEFTVFRDDGIHYVLYNPATKLFFASGNSWNTMASLRTFGMEIWLKESSEGYYELWDNNINNPERSTGVLNMFTDDDNNTWVDHNNQGKNTWSYEIVNGCVRFQNVSLVAGNSKYAGTYLGFDGTYVISDNILTSFNHRNAYTAILRHVSPSAEGVSVDWKAVTVESYENFVNSDEYEVYVNGAKQYIASVGLKKAIEDAEALFIDVTAAMAVYTNAESTAEDMSNATSALTELIFRQTDGLWTMPEPAGLEFTEFTDDGTHYVLYNPATKLFFASGNSWNTMASLRTFGMEIWLKESSEGYEGYYELWDNNVNNPERSTGILKMFTSDDNNTYVDNVDQSNNTCWAYKTVNGYVRFQNVSLIAGNSKYAGTYLGFDGTYVVSDNTEDLPNHRDAYTAILRHVNPSAEGVSVDWKAVTVESYENFVNSDDYEAYVNGAKQYIASAGLKKAIEDAEALFIDVTAAVAVYTNAESTAEDMANATTALTELISRLTSTTYTVAGSASILNGNDSWIETNTGNDMVSKDGVNYTLTVSGVNVNAGKYEFKVVQDHNWANCWPEENRLLTIYETAKYDIVYTFNAETKDINATATKLGEFEGNPIIYTVAGFSTLLGTEWDPTDTANDMVIGEGGIYNLVKENVDLIAMTYEYKVVVNHEWEICYPGHGEENAKLILDEDGRYNVSFTFNAITKEVNATATKVGEFEGRKVTIYVQAKEAPYLYLWKTIGDGSEYPENQIKGKWSQWPGKQMINSVVKTDKYGDQFTFWYQSFSLNSFSSFNILFNNGNQKTADINDIASDRYFIYDGRTNYTDISEYFGTYNNYNYLTNGDMEGDDVSCFFTKIDRGTIRNSEITDGVGKDGSRGVVVKALEKVSDAGDNQFWIRFHKPLSVGIKYRITFDYHADKEAEVSTQAHAEPGEYNCREMLGTLNFTQEWQTFSVEGIVTEDQSPSDKEFRSIAFNLSELEEANCYYFDNFKLEVIEILIDSYVTNGDMEGDDVSCFFTKIDRGTIRNSEMTDGVGKNGSRGIVVKALEKVSDVWDNQFWIRFHKPLIAGTKYRVIFDYRADKEAEVSTQAHAEPSKYNCTEMLGSLNFTQEWQTFSFEGIVTEDQSPSDKEFRSIAFNLSQFEKANNYYFDNVKVKVFISLNDICPFFSVKDDSLSINCIVPATIYYTLDGTTPTQNSSVYKEPIILNKNCTIRAIAVAGNDEDSRIVATYNVDWFVVSPIVIEQNLTQISMNTETSEAKIYYTLDGTVPAENSNLYTAPFNVTDSCTIKAIGIKEDFKPSEVTTYIIDIEKITVEIPQFTRNENTLVLTTNTQDATIYYTTDGSEPTTASAEYKEAISFTKNCMVKAIAIKEGFKNSKVGTYSVDWFKVEPVLFDNDGRRVELSTSTTETTIYYTLDGSVPIEESSLYTEPIMLTGSCTVKAIAVRDGYTSSDVSSFAFDKSDYTVSTPTFAKDGNTVKIETDAKGTSIYYTLDGTVPTSKSTLYEDSIVVTRNCIIKAIAVRENWFDSEIGTYEVNTFKVDVVQFSNDGRRVALSTPTTDATIHYTLDGSVPTEESFLYTEPIMLTGSCTVKAIAVRDGYTSSDVSSFAFDKSDYTVSPLQFVREGNELKISTFTENSSIFYTLDGTDPTSESNLYGEAIVLTRNCTVRAIALRENWFDSEIAVFVVSDFNTAEPSFSLSNDLLSMSCSTEGSIVRYSFDPNAEKSTFNVYSGALTITDNHPVRAFAEKEGWNDSEVVTFTPTTMGCSEVAISYDGHSFRLTANEGAAIHYTLDGSDPTEQSTVYSEPTAVDGLCTVKAVAMKPWMNPSAMSTKEITYFYDGAGTAMTKDAGLLASAFEWCGTENVEQLSIVGSIGTVDLETLRSMRTLKHLNLQSTALQDNTLPDEAFAGTNLLSISLPASVSTFGANLFKDCRQLAAITWNSSKAIPAQTLQGIGNPNMLLYVPILSIAMQTGVKNIVVNGMAQRIELADVVGDGNNNFYCPTPFRAENISYIHRYGMTTAINHECRGWETIALPFTVSTITHETKGNLAPFAANDDTKKPFWLLKVENNDFVDAVTIEANKPYVISMPNNDEYGDEYNLAGNITFSGMNVDVPVTQPCSDQKRNICLTASFQHMEQSESILTINEYTPYDNYLEGSVFLADSRSVRPFEAYATLVQSGMRLVPIFDSDMPQGLGVITCKRKQTKGVYNLQGQRLAAPRKGLNIVDGKKLLRVKR